MDGRDGDMRVYGADGVGLREARSDMGRGTLHPKPSTPLLSCLPCTQLLNKCNVGLYSSSLLFLIRQKREFQVATLWPDPAKASATLKADFLSDEIARFKGSGSTSSSTQRLPLTAIKIALPWTSEIIYIFICMYCYVWKMLSWKAGNTRCAIGKKMLDQVYCGAWLN